MAVDLRGQSLSVIELIAMVRSEDINDQYYAAWVLGNRKDPEAVEVLVEALQDTENRTELGGYPLRRRAAEALGRIQDLRAVPPLLAALDTPDIYLKEAVVWSLGELADPRAILPLVALLNPAAAEPHEILIESLGKLARHHPRAMADAQSLILAYLDQGTERVRCAAARTLYLMTKEDHYGEILQARLQSSDLQIRRCALFDLAECAYLPAAAAIAQCDVTDNLKVHALKQMMDLSPDQSPEALTGVLDALATLL
jgi:HEAT repeat protein